LNLEESQKFSFAVAQELRRIRLAQGMSQLALSQKAGISRAAVQHIEKGIRNPTLMLLHALACSLGVKLSDVIATIERRE